MDEHRLVHDDMHTAQRDIHDLEGRIESLPGQITEAARTALQNSLMTVKAMAQCAEPEVSYCGIGGYSLYPAKQLVDELTVAVSQLRVAVESATGRALT